MLITLLAYRPLVATAQKAAKPTYLQIFYEGDNWLAGREVLHYSPAFRGKTGELVREDSTRAVSLGALIFDGPTETVVTNTLESVITDKSLITDKGTFVPDENGKMRLLTAADIRKRHLKENAGRNHGINLLATRAALGRTALTNALNEAAADGWEVVQMTSWGAQGGLVYLLRRR